MGKIWTSQGKLNSHLAQSPEKYMVEYANAEVVELEFVCTDSTPAKDWCKLRVDVKKQRELDRKAAHEAYRIKAAQQTIQKAQRELEILRSNQIDA